MISRHHWESVVGRRPQHARVRVKYIQFIKYSGRPTGTSSTSTMHNFAPSTKYNIQYTTIHGTYYVIIFLETVIHFITPCIIGIIHRTSFQVFVLEFTPVWGRS